MSVEQSISNNGTGVSDLDLPSWSPAADELLLIFAAISGNKTATVTGNGLTYDLIDSQDQGGNQGVTISAYRAMSATTPSSGVVTIDQGTTSAIVGLGVRISGVFTTGVNGADAVSAAVLNNAADTSANLAITPAAAGRIVIGAYAYESADLTFDDGTFTELLLDLQAGAGNFITRLASAYKVIPTAVSTDIDGTLDASNNWAGIALEILGPSGRRKPRTMMI